jgi:hypothetical protein
MLESHTDYIKAGERVRELATGLLRCSTPFLTITYSINLQFLDVSFALLRFPPRSSAMAAEFLVVLEITMRVEPLPTKQTYIGYHLQ